MHQGQRGFEQGIGQVREIGEYLVAVEHALVDQGLAREAGDIKHVALLELGVLDQIFRQLADDIELALKGKRIIERRPLPLPMKICRMTGSNRRAVSPTRELSVGTVAPTEKLLAFVANDFFK